MGILKQAAWILWVCAYATASERPNIVLILADDMGYSDLGCYGGEIDTPNLDRLGANGLRFTDFHNAARCCPTRASLLTGLYPHETGVGHMVYEDLGEGYLGHLNDRCVTLAQVLAAAGYQTLMSGKWHVGHQMKEVLPEQRGFAQFFGTYLHVDSYFKVLPDCDIWRNGVKQIDGSWERLPDDPKLPGREFYTTDVYTDAAIDFIGQALKKDAPFFLYLAYNAPHWPLEAPERNLAKYRNRYHGGWDRLREQKWRRMQELGVIAKGTPLSPSENTPWSEVKPADREELAFRRAIYAAQVDRLDENVGRVIQFLEASGQLENTLILFLSDNGCSAEEGMFGYGFQKNRIANFDAWRAASGRSASQGQAWANVSNVPFRRYKKDTYEGGSRTPLIVHWPRGVTGRGWVRTPGHITDIMPTLAEVADTFYPGDAPPMRGRSLVPLFENPDEVPDSLQNRTIYWEHEGNRAIRSGDWKMVSSYERGPGGGRHTPWELYHLADDPVELKDLAAAQPDKVCELEADWTTWAKDVKALPNLFERRAAKR